jgi:hypothetical protein
LILGWSVKLPRPRDKEHRAFQHESVLVFGLTEPEQEALHCPAAQQKLEILLARMSEGEKLGPV